MMPLKHCIPLQRIEQVEIKLVSHNVVTNYYNFEIMFIGVTDTKIRLTRETIRLINEESKKMVNNIKESEHNND